MVMPTTCYHSLMQVRRGRLYVFRKSGNLVRAIAPTTYGERCNWVVQRVAGEELVVLGRASIGRSCLEAD